MFSLFTNAFGKPPRLKSINFIANINLWLGSAASALPCNFDFYFVILFWQKFNYTIISTLVNRLIPWATLMTPTGLCHHGGCRYLDVYDRQGISNHHGNFLFPLILHIIFIIISIKSEMWISNHRFELGHETIVCAVMYVLLCSFDSHYIATWTYCFT